MIGEDISILCVVHNRSPDAIEEIIWRVGTSDLCFENNEFLIWNTQNITHKVGRWRLQKSEKIFLLYIESVKDSDSLQYCCEVNTRTRSDGRSSTHGTQVVIAGKIFSVFNIKLHNEEQKIPLEAGLWRHFDTGQLKSI